MFIIQSIVPIFNYSFTKLKGVKMLMQHFINILASTSKGRSEIYLHIQKFKKKWFYSISPICTTNYTFTGLK